MQSVDEGEKAIQRGVTKGAKYVFSVADGRSSALRIQHSQANYMLPSSKLVIPSHTTHSLLSVYHSNLIYFLE